MSLSQSVSALLNATFGNAVELLVGIVALQQDQLRLVQTSMLGSILSNILLVLGCSFAAAGTVYKESTFRMTAAQTSSGIMTLACVGLVIPAACRSSHSSLTCGCKEIVYAEPLFAVFSAARPLDLRSIAS